MSTSETRISKLRDYLYNVLSSLVQSTNYKINADWLGKVGDFSLDKIPTESTVVPWIIPMSIKRDLYSFRSRKTYSPDDANNLANIGFFEQFEKIINSNNNKGVLPDIEGVESIECLNCGTFNSQDGTQATFDIQIQVTYRDNEEKEVVSL